MPIKPLPRVFREVDWYMELSEKFKLKLDNEFDWKISNISNLDSPVLIISGYSPTNEARPFSFAFELPDGTNKCWLSNELVKEIDGTAPKHHPDYSEFFYNNCLFYPFSVQLPYNIFIDFSIFKDICKSLYSHIKQ